MFNIYSNLFNEIFQIRFYLLKVYLNVDFHLLSPYFRNQTICEGDQENSYLCFMVMAVKEFIFGFIFSLYS